MKRNNNRDVTVTIQWSADARNVSCHDNDGAAPIVEERLTLQIVMAVTSGRGLS